MKADYPPALQAGRGGLWEERKVVAKDALLEFLVWVRKNEVRRGTLLRKKLEILLTAEKLE